MFKGRLLDRCKSLPFTVLMSKVKKTALLAGMVFLFTLPVLRAGSVTPLADQTAPVGKLTLTADSIQVEGSSNSFKLPDVLAADFSDAPFHLDYFSSMGDTAKTLPPDWKGQDIGKVDIHGTVAYGDGAFQLTSDGNDAHDDDRYYFVGRPWQGDGQWTVRVKAILGDNQGGEAGVMLRNGFEELSPIFGIGVNTQTGLFHYRDDPGTHAGWGGDFNALLPQWLRLTKSGTSIDGDYSSDGRQWSIIGQYGSKVEEQWIGLWVNSRSTKVTGKAILDQVIFTPGPAEPMTMPPGVLLKSGSFVAGRCDGMDTNGGSFVRAGKSFPIKPEQVAMAVWHPVTLKQLAAVAGQTGIILRNGDLQEGDFNNLNGGGAQVTSVIMGQSWYWSDMTRACVLRQVEPQAAPYEIRLKDGSIIYASGLGVNNGQLLIAEISGLSIGVSADEIAQFRAGPTCAEDLIGLLWKATPAFLPPATGEAPPTPPAIPAVAATNTPAAPAGDPSVVCWEGPNQEQIMVVAQGTKIDFPLKGKFTALSLQIALSPDSLPQAQATVRILADGKEIGETPAFKAGDQPRGVRVTVANPSTITLEAKSATSGTRVLLIDPVAVREAQP